MGLYGDSPGGDDGQEDNMRPRKFTSVEEKPNLWSTEATDVSRHSKKDVGGPLRAIGISTWAPSRVGLMCRVYVKPRASSRFHIWPRKREQHQDEKTTCAVDVENENQNCFTWRRSSTLFVVDNGHILALPGLKSSDSTYVFGFYSKIFKLAH